MTRAALGILFASQLPLLAMEPKVEQSNDLGFGFRRVILAEEVNTSFESVGHFAYLFYRDRKLSQIDECSVAPSGRFAAYQDGPSGNLFLFRRADGKIAQLTPKFPGLANKFVWREKDGHIEISFQDGYRTKKFPLR